MSEQQQNEQQPQFAMQRIYIKDASMESPNAPQVFLKQWQPEVNMDMNSQAKPLDDNNFEVVLTVTVTAKNDGETAFLVEVQQAGIFTIAGLKEDELHHTLGAFCPNILFPYARESVDTLVTKASFPPLMLAPVNFDALYAQQLQQQAAQQAEETH
ncbi:protein-export chaperone SecB [Marinobacterium arenosum]|uniref:protein-export chaperone SecB n=1 Tax=Marinobacterium arenosum TaxID=2862496 RepID=UPI001C97F40B|nr:protein-export chaperone SecB [Marinobacterium arenosum]MBY4678909.1 protein-export chaperone SecB [Marinobacterium arenosum]